MKTALEVISLGRLIETGVIKRSARNAHLIERFGLARWIEPTRRKEEWRLRGGMLPTIEAHLETMLPSWRSDFKFLRSLNLNPLDLRSIDSLGALRGQKKTTGLINRRNWNAASGLGPKHVSQIPPSAILTKDWVMRFKPNKGLRAVFDDLELDLWQLSETLTECAIPERLWLKLQRFEGTEPDLIVTCENLGAYIDLPMPCGYMVVYAPGANIETAVKILKYFPETRWFHFGDVDPDGLKIAQTLAREAKRPLTFFVPSFAEEYLPGRPVKKPWGEVPGRKVFQELKRKHTRLFQEVFMLDGRLNSEINGLSSAAMEEKDNLHCIMVR